MNKREIAMKVYNAGLLINKVKDEEEVLLLELENEVITKNEMLFLQTFKEFEDITLYNNKICLTFISG